MRRPLLLVLAVLLAVVTDLGASGCVGLPDSGPVRTWSLDEKGLGRVLLDNQPSRYFPDSIEISPSGEFHSRRSGQPNAEFEFGPED